MNILTHALCGVMILSGCSQGTHDDDPVDSATPGAARTLFEAARNNDVDGTERLIAAGARVNDFESGFRPLHWAARRGHVEVARMLIANGADPHAKADNSWTPLHFASDRGHTDMVRLLLKCHINVNTSDNVRLTPLHLAARNGHVEIVRALLEAGADPEAQSGVLLETPGWMAFWRGHGDVVKVIREHERK